MSSRAGTNIILIRVTFLPVGSNRPIISLFLARSKPIREIFWSPSPRYGGVVNSWSILASIDWIRSRSNWLLSCLLDENVWSLCFIDGPVITASWRRWVCFVSLVNVVLSWAYGASVICEPCYFGNKNALGHLLVILLLLFFLMEIKLQNWGKEPAWNRRDW